MKIVIAPDSFKESLTAIQVAEAIEQGFREIYPQAEYIKLPMADGGEGTVKSMIAATGGEIIDVEVIGPLHQSISAFYGLLSDGVTAIIEMAAASGLHLVPTERRDPLRSTSFGTGQLILSALDKGAHKIILGIGGSATNDGGAGMMQALGVRFLDKYRHDLADGGAALSELQHIELSSLDARLAQTEIIVACDVDNPLCGAEGATAVFGPQKGATPNMINILDKALFHYGKQIEATTGRAIINVAGAGAAGGMGAALLGLLDVQLKPGIDIVMNTLGLEAALAGADLIITGEGRIDRQTIHGKTPMGVAHLARRLGIPVIALAGEMAPDYQVVHKSGLDAVFSVVNRVATRSEALAEAQDNLRVTARNVAAVWRLASFTGRR